MVFEQSLAAAMARLEHFWLTHFVGLRRSLVSLSLIAVLGGADGRGLSEFGLSLLAARSMLCRMVRLGRVDAVERWWWVCRANEATTIAEEAWLRKADETRSRLEAE